MQEILEKEYNYLCWRFGVKSSIWSMLHEKFSPFTFCDANKKTIITEYLLLEDFVERAKTINFPYYYGVDEFLREYKEAVYNSLNL